ncbi:MAG: PAS domain-containing sensor histidine kinase [Muribaculaceae bacterium]|nr:PAS domain-containing sensor histidine kinase [Muribaculaceae bacterium]
MASEKIKSLHVAPMVWIAMALLFAFGGGYSLAVAQNLWVILAVCSICCGYIMVINISKISKRMRYVMQASLSNDFSYRFATRNVSKEEREINEILNRIVEHLERLTLEVRKNEAFLSRIINLTDIGLAVADANGNIRLHNEATLRLLERSALTNVCQIPEQAFIDLDIRKSEVTVNDKSFTLFTISDLSRKMQAVEVKSWEKLTRVLTHEIMNSLTPIQSIAENMSGKATTRDMSEALDTISSSSGSLMQFVRNFREFSILPEPQMRVIYLKPLLESCRRMAVSHAGDKQISFSLICFPPELMVYTDESLLSRVLINILKNAIEANPRTIAIEADVKADDSVEIRISNDGEAISEETAQHMFTPFFTTRESGNGIGLSLSRRIITHLGGTLTFKTKPVTCFSVKI